LYSSASRVNIYFFKHVLGILDIGIENIYKINNVENNANETLLCILNRISFILNVVWYIGIRYYNICIPTSGILLLYAFIFDIALLFSTRESSTACI